MQCSQGLISAKRGTFTSRKAFTLIELLVVIAIIAILAAILFPVFAQAREKARQTSCLSNIKQLTLGFMMYSQDYDEQFPQWQWDVSWASGTGKPANNGTSLWCNAIFPYVKNSQVYNCPSDARGLTVRDAFAGWFNFDKTLIGFPDGMLATKISYGMNEPMSYLNGKQGLAAMDKPSETFVIGDVINPLSGWSGYGEYTNAVENNKPQTDIGYTGIVTRIAFPKSVECVGNNATQQKIWGGDILKQEDYLSQYDACSRHSRGSNIGFADGHAKFVQMRNAKAPLFGIHGY